MVLFAGPAPFGRYGPVGAAPGATVSSTVAAIAWCISPGPGPVTSARVALVTSAYHLVLGGSYKLHVACTLVLGGSNHPAPSTTYPARRSA